MLCVCPSMNFYCYATFGCCIPCFIILNYNAWLKLNEQSRTATGKKLNSIEAKIAKIENSIVNTKNKAILQKEKGKIASLKKARIARKPKISVTKSIKETIKGISITGKKTIGAKKKPLLKIVKETPKSTKSLMSRTAENKRQFFPFIGGGGCYIYFESDVSITQVFNFKFYNNA